jgi:hypothetical protein
MKTITINQRPVKLYSSIKELPIGLSKKMQNYLLQASGIGSSIEDIDERLSRIMVFIGSDKREDAMEEAKNLRYALFSAISEMDYKSPAFACLVHSIDEREVTDRSIEGLNEVIEKLEGITESDIADTLEDVKKNWIPSGSFTSLSSSALT